MLKEFINLIYPRICLACDRALEGGEDTICTFCRFDLPKTNFHLSKDNFLEQRLWGKLPITHAFAFLFFVKHGKVQRLIHNLKYKGHEEIGSILGKWYGFDLGEAGLSNNFDLIIPIPLHKNKLKKRGYNQCDTFSVSLSQALDIPVSLNGAKRITATKTQTRKSRFARWQNVEEIFVSADPSEIKDKRILLVDDVVTTGSTIESCGNALLKDGAKEISVACIAMSQ